MGRWEAAKELDLATVPVVRVQHLSKAQLKLFSIADNKLPEGVRWDADALLLEIQEIECEAPELELTASGFEIAELDRCMVARALPSWPTSMSPPRFSLVRL